MRAIDVYNRLGAAVPGFYLLFWAACLVGLVAHWVHISQMDGWFWPLYGVASTIIAPIGIIHGWAWLGLVVAGVL